MATDMAFHFDMCKRMDVVLASKASHAADELLFDKKNESDRQFLFDILIHSGDLQSICVPLSIAKKWGERITQEFTSQAAAEDARGLPVAEFMRNLDNNVNIGIAQRGFVDFVCTPYFTKLTQLYPQLNDCLLNMRAIRQFYDGLANSDSTQTSSTSNDNGNGYSSSLNEVSVDIKSSIVGKWAHPDPVAVPHRLGGIEESSVSGSESSGLSSPGSSQSPGSIPGITRVNSAPIL